jgi:hypothetical protein
VRHRVTRVVCALTGAIVLASCSKSSPSSPGTPDPTPTSITVSSTGANLFLGSTETFTATVALSNGTVQPLTGGVWGTDAGSVATVVTATGAVTGVSSGEATIFVDSQGIRGSKRIAVLPNYAGVWGDDVNGYSVTSCTQTGDWVAEDVCGIGFTVGSRWPVAFNFQQSNRTVTGLTALGGVLSSGFTGTIAANGSLPFQAVGTISGDGLNISFNQTWQLNITQASRLDGTVVATITDPSLSGQAVVSGTLLGVGRAGAANVSSLRPVRTGSSLRETIAAVLGGR